MKLFYNTNKNVLINLALLSCIWISINTGSKYLIIDYNLSGDINTYTNLIRSLLPYLVFCYFILKKDIYFKDLFVNFDLVFICFLLYGLFQLTGLIYTYTNLHEHYWIVCLFTLIFFFNYLLNNQNSYLIKLVFKINIFFIFLLFLIFMITVFKENIFTTKLLYSSSAYHLTLMGEPHPRSSGLSRMALIFLIFLNSYYFSNKLPKKYNFFILPINSFLIFTIYIIQSRGAILFLFILFFLILLIYNFKDFKLNLVYFVFTILIPIFMFMNYPVFKNFINQKNLNTESIVEKTTSLNLSNIFRPEITHVIGQKKNSLFKKETINAMSSNRLNAWEYLIQVFFTGKVNDKMKKLLTVSGYEALDVKLIKKTNFITGLGPQADRQVMEIKKIANFADNVRGPFGSHASNIYIYSLICSGFFGLVTILTINFIIMYRIIILFINRKKLSLHSNYYLNSAILIILFLQFRGLVENSYGVFGVDLIMFISSYSIIARAYKKINV